MSRQDIIAEIVNELDNMSYRDLIAVLYYIQS